MLKSKIKFTYNDYKNLPESETKRYELLEGELVMVPSPTTRHQRILVNLEDVLHDFVRKHGLGFVYVAPLDVVFSEWDVAQPDIFFISRERSEIVTEENIRGAPDLVIEILSPATADRDRTYKRTLYARHGISEYWLADPDKRTIEVMKLGEKGFESLGVYTHTLSSPTFPGLTISLAEVFW